MNFSPELRKKYEPLNKLGQGGMGEVWLARDVVRGGQVAIKSVLASSFEDEEARLRFLRETKITRALSHPNIIREIDQGEDGGLLYIVLEYVEGGGLGAYLKQRGAMGPSTFHQIAVQILDAVAYAHRCGVLHRDLKTDNILLDRELHPKIADFGLAKGIDNAGLETTDGTMMGTPIYMAPELARGQKATIATDQYALGVILYQMLCARPPLLAENPLDMLQKHIQVVPPLVSQYRPDVPQALALIIHRSLAKQPQERFPDVLAFRDAINELPALGGGWGGNKVAFATIAPTPPSRAERDATSTSQRSSSKSRNTPVLIPLPPDEPVLVKIPDNMPSDGGQLERTQVYPAAPPAGPTPRKTPVHGTPLIPLPPQAAPPPPAPTPPPPAPPAPTPAPPTPAPPPPAPAAAPPPAASASGFSILSLVACALIAGLVLWSARHAPHGGGAITIADLQSGTVKGALGLPLGQVLTAAGVVVDGASTGRKADEGLTLLRIESVNGAPLAQPVVVPFVPPAWKPMKGPAVGSKFSFTGYESGGFAGLPDGAVKALGSVPATTGWAWTIEFQVLDAAR